MERNGTIARQLLSIPNIQDVISLVCASSTINNIVAMMAYLSILLFLPVLWTLYSIYCLVVNYSKASNLGLPLVICAITPDNPLWIAFQTAFGSILRFFPFAAISFTRYCRLGWEFHDRYQTHSKLGDVWMLVTPARNWLYIANAEAVTEIFSRGRDFTRPVWMLGMSSYLTRALI